MEHFDLWDKPQWGVVGYSPDGIWHVSDVEVQDCGRDGVRYVGHMVAVLPAAVRAAIVEGMAALDAADWDVINAVADDRIPHALKMRDPGFADWIGKKGVKAAVVAVMADWYAAHHADRWAAAVAKAPKIGRARATWASWGGGDDVGGGQYSKMD